ncbi:hypothetical protein DL93DRAFT_245631 [Clavulina sp. PMI_390]|nr:hypothetical protein DL93DRAFT_245631 [Clavulina sp. PMI_390]
MVHATSVPLLKINPRMDGRRVNTRNKPILESARRRFLLGNSSMMAHILTLWTQNHSISVVKSAQVASASASCHMGTSKTTVRAMGHSSKLLGPKSLLPQLDHRLLRNPLTRPGAVDGSLETSRPDSAFIDRTITLLFFCLSCIISQARFEYFVLHRSIPIIVS